MRIDPEQWASLVASAIKVALVPCIAHIEAQKSELATLRAEVERLSREQPDIAALVAAEMAKIPPGRDGRDGLPGLTGEKGFDGAAGRDGVNGINGIDGKDGHDGLGFDDFEVEYDGDQTLTFKFMQGDRVKAFPIKCPFAILKGDRPWNVEMTYSRGHQTYFAESIWMATKETTGVLPGNGQPDWLLIGKRGRQGKPGPKGDKGEKGDTGPQGPVVTKWS